MTTAPKQKLRLGVNIDHVATLRNARGGGHPSPLQAARVAAVAGADGITAHLREDRRHIRDLDIGHLKDKPANMYTMIASNTRRKESRGFLSACGFPSRSGKG